MFVSLLRNRPVKLVVFGVGILADLAQYYFEHDSPLEVAGFTADKSYVNGTTYNGLPLVPFENVDKHFPPEQYSMFVAVGYANGNRTREEKCHAAKDRGYELASYISSRSVNMSEHCGSNCFILENVVLQPFVSIADGVIVWSGAVVSHHSTIDGFCYLSPNVTISGTCQIGRRVFVGAGAVLRDGTRVSEDIVIGMGSVVTADLSDRGIFRGNPARFSQAISQDTKI